LSEAKESHWAPEKEVARLPFFVSGSENLRVRHQHSHMISFKKVENLSKKEKLFRFSSLFFPEASQNR